MRKYGAPFPLRVSLSILVSHPSENRASVGIEVKGSLTLESGMKANKGFKLAKSNSNLGFMI